jgi:hypothetical protein
MGLVGRHGCGVWSVRAGVWSVRARYEEGSLRYDEEVTLK